jgi:tRNA dimethylallyltransferase
MDLALRLGGEIVSCDSVQVYRGLDIGSGKPSRADRARVPHHLIDILDIEGEMNAALFARLAGAAIAEIDGRGRLPIVTGGTGLYLTALLKGLFEQGTSDPSVRRRLEALAERHGSARLHRLLAAKDPEYAKRTQPGDRVRIVRALEVCLVQGRPFTQAQQERRPAYSGEALVVGLHPGREELRDRVTERVAGMIGRGLIEETRQALERAPEGGPLPRPLGAIGYREAVASIASGVASVSRDGELQRAIVTSTMQYAKRQMTYFRRQFDVEWFAESAAAAERVAGWVASQDMGKQE